MEAKGGLKTLIKENGEKKWISDGWVGAGGRRKMDYGWREDENIEKGGREIKEEYRKQRKTGLGMEGSVGREMETGSGRRRVRLVAEEQAVTSRPRCVS